MTLTQAEALVLLEEIQGKGEHGSELIELEQRLIDFVYPHTNYTYHKLDA